MKNWAQPPRSPRLANNEITDAARSASLAVQSVEPGHFFVDVIAAAHLGITLPEWQIARCGTVASVETDCAAILACREAGAPAFARWAIFANLKAADVLKEIRGLNS